MRRSSRRDDEIPRDLVPNVPSGIWPRCDVRLRPPRLRHRELDPARGGTARAGAAKVHGLHFVQPRGGSQARPRLARARDLSAPLRDRDLARRVELARSMLRSDPENGPPGRGSPSGTPAPARAAGRSSCWSRHGREAPSPRASIGRFVIGGCHCWMRRGASSMRCSRTIRRSLPGSRCIGERWVPESRPPPTSSAALSARLQRCSVLACSLFNSSLS